MGTLGGIRIARVEPTPTAPAPRASEYPYFRMLGMATLDMTAAAATLAPDMAPKMPQANTVAMASPPRRCDSQVAAAL